MKIATFGEALFRISCLPGENLLHSTRVHFDLGGSELNVATNYAALGGSSRWISVIPEGFAGEMILARLKALSLPLDLLHVKTAMGQMGYYFFQNSAAPRRAEVPLRQKSLFDDSMVVPVHWATALESVQLFHSSGITAGLGVNSLGRLQEAHAEAKKKKVLVSFDSNYRRSLWSEEQAKRAHIELLPSIDVLFASDSDLHRFYEVSDGQLLSWFEKQNLKCLVSPHRSEKGYGVRLLAKGEKEVQSKKFHHSSIDPVGVGDAMVAGFLWTYLHQEPLQKCADFAAATGVSKYAVKGDMNLIRSSEIQALLDESHLGVLR